MRPRPGWSEWRISTRLALLAAIAWSLLATIVLGAGGPIWVVLPTLPLTLLSIALLWNENLSRGLPIGPRDGWFQSSAFHQRLLGSAIGILIAILVIYLKSR